MLYLAKLKILNFFFRKPIFFEITPKSERFEKSYYFSRIIRQICYFYLFLGFSFFSKNPSPFWEKKWTFWEILNFQSHSTTFLLSLAIFKSWCFFWKNSSYFFSKKNWTFWKLLLFLSHSTANLLLLPFFKLFIFFQKIHQFLGKKMNVLRNRNLSVAFYDNFAIFSDFEEFMFFQENVI